MHSSYTIVPAVSVAYASASNKAVSNVAFMYIGSYAIIAIYHYVYI